MINNGFQQLFAALAKHRQITIVGPGTAALWKIAPRFDELAGEIFQQARQTLRQRCTFITLDALFSKLARRDVWHPANTTANRLLFTEHLVRAVFVNNALAAIGLTAMQVGQPPGLQRQRDTALTRYVAQFAVAQQNVQQAN